MSETKIVRTICFDSHSKCGILVHVKDGKIVKVEGDPNHPCSKGSLCCKAFSVAQIHEHPDRLKYPLRRAGARGAGEWKRISWDEALDEIVEKIAYYKESHGVRSILMCKGTGRGSNHFHTRINETIGNPSRGMAPTHVCLMPNLLPSLFTVGFFCYIDAADLLNCKCMTMWGINPLTSWAGTSGRQMLEAKRKGAKLIVIDPRFTDVSAKADLWLQIRPGTDCALALTLTKVIIDEELYDKKFVEEWCLGFEELKESVAEWTPEKGEETTWIPKEQIIKAARMMAANRPTNVTPSLGTGMHENGMQAGRAIMNLFAIMGDIDTPGGLLSNRFWDCMLNPKITLNDPSRNRLLWGSAEKPFLTMGGSISWPKACFDAMKNHKIRMLIDVAADPMACYENVGEVVEGMGQLEYIVIMDYFHNDVTRIADIVLPAAHWVEREGAYDEELYSDPCPVVIPQKVVDPPGECWDDWEFFLALGKRLSPELWPWEDSRDMWRWRLREFYDVDKSWEELAEEAYLVTYGGEKRVYEKYKKGLERKDGEMGFRTPSGKIELKSEAFAGFGYSELPSFAMPSIYRDSIMEQEYPLVLMTGGRLYPFYHSAFTNIPMQRELAPDPFIEMHPDAAKARNISHGDWVEITSPGGRKIKSKAVVTKSLDPRVVHIPRPVWKHACKELGLEGYGATKANENVLIPAEPSDEFFGMPPMRSWRCEVTKKGE